MWKAIKNNIQLAFQLILIYILININMYFVRLFSSMQTASFLSREIIIIKKL